MRNIIVLGVLLLIFTTVQSQKMTPTKKAIIASVEKHKESLIIISDTIWVKDEFKQRKGDEVYKPIIPEGPPPIDFK